MKKIELSKIEIADINMDFGDESQIYKLSGKEEVYKEWIKTKKINTEVILNKVRKLEELEKRDDSIFEFLVRPEDLVVDKEKYTGYTMEKYDGEKPSGYLNYKEAVILLKKIKKAILELEEKGIRYLDLNHSNILYKITDGEINFKIVDIDNAIVDDMEMDLIPPFIYRYLAVGGKLDKNALIYAYNCLTVRLLSNYDMRLSGNTFIPNYNRRLAKFGELCDRPQTDTIIDNEYLIDSYDENSNMRRALI